MLDTIIETKSNSVVNSNMSLLVDIIYRLNKIKKQLSEHRHTQTKTDESRVIYNKLVSKKTLFMKSLSQVKGIEHNIIFQETDSVGMFAVSFTQDKKCIHISHLKPSQIHHFVTNKSELLTKIIPLITNDVAKEIVLGSIKRMPNVL